MWWWVGLALARPIGLDRVDVLSEDPGSFLDEHVARFGASPTVTSIRFAEQLKVVVRLPWEGVLLGVSAATQSLYVEGRVAGPVGLTGGLQTRLGLPRGGLVGVHLRQGPVRIGLSANVLSTATWARPDLSGWRVLPGLGIGFGPSRQRAPVPSPWADPLAPSRR